MEPKKNKAIGILVSLGFHTLIIFLFFVLPGFIINNGLQEENISLKGGSDPGSGGEYNSLEINPSYIESIILEKPNIITADDPEGIPIPRAEKLSVKPVLASQPIVKTEKIKTIDKNSIFNSHHKGAPGKGIGEEGAGPGNSKGLEPEHEKVNIPTAKNQMRGRAQIQYPQFENDFEEEGKLVFRIVVDAQGNIKDIKESVPTTIANKQQINKAKALILSYAKFAPKPGAEEEGGYYTIIFKKH